MRRRGWPQGLRERDGYYSWIDPKSGRELGIGRVPYGTAARQALEANLKRAGESGQRRLVDRLDEGGERTVNAWCDRFEELLEERTRAAATKKAHDTYLRATRAALGTLGITRVDTLAINEKLLKVYRDAGKERAAQACRSLLIDMFDMAEAEGWRPPGSNPVRVTYQPAVEVRRARLTLDGYLTIYDAAGALDPWVQRSMELALMSGQRREDLAVGEFRRREASTCFVEDGRLWVDQGKTGSRLRIPLELRLNVVNLSLDEVVRRCRDAIASPWLIHHSVNRHQSEPGDQVWIDTISKGFTRARKRTSLAWPGQTPPTFHELRSLSERLYADQGVNTQELLGHKDPRSTRTYHDSRGAEWIDVKVA